MRLRLVTSLAVVFAVAPAAAQERSVRIVNGTGEPAIGLSIGGGRNLIAGRILPSGAAVTVTAPGTCRADLRLVLSSGTVLDWPGADLCSRRDLFFTRAVPGRAPAAGDPPSPPGQMPGQMPQAPAVSAPSTASVQRALAALGYDPGPADGVAGPRTRQAIAAFQRDRGLQATGVLDAATLAALRLAVASGPPDGAGAPEREGGKPPPSANRPQPSPGAVARVVPVPPPADQAQRQGQRRASTGTGFIVSEGRVLTNHHVTDGCARMVGVLADGRRVELAIGPRDASRDLALLSGPNDLGPPLAFRNGPPRRGDEVVTYGFPLIGILGTGPSLTTGEISALNGLRGDPNTLIMSAPVQSGNSGGPLLDRGGNVVGVIVAKLAALRVAERTGGDLPQNVNFAVHGSVAVDFLRRNGVTPKLQPTLATLPAAEVGEIAHPSTLLLECWR